MPTTHQTKLSAVEWALLDAATRQAQADIDDMHAILDAGFVRAQKFFADIASVKAAACKAE